MQIGHATQWIGRVLQVALSTWDQELFLGSTGSRSQTIRAASSSLRIQCFMTNPNTQIRFHFIRDCIWKGAMKLQYVPTGEQVADILTKTLMKGKFVFFRDKLGVVRNTFLAKREC
jgi:hypothetical protein